MVDIRYGVYISRIGLPKIARLTRIIVSHLLLTVAVTERKRKTVRFNGVRKHGFKREKKKCERVSGKTC